MTNLRDNSSQNFCPILDFISLTLNEQVVQNIDFDDHEELKYRLRDGFIRITDHNDYVAWKNIRIKRL